MLYETTDLLFLTLDENYRRIQKERVLQAEVIAQNTWGRLDYRNSQILFFCIVLVGRRLYNILLKGCVTRMSNYKDYLLKFLKWFHALTYVSKFTKNLRLLHSAKWQRQILIWAISHNVKRDVSSVLGIIHRKLSVCMWYINLLREWSCFSLPTASVWCNLRDSIWKTVHSDYLSKEEGPKIIGQRNGVLLEKQTLKK